jgi:hypothetical protein
MRRLTSIASALGIAVSALAFSAPAGAVVFGTGNNDIFFNNFENLYRATGNCNDETCFASPSDPTGYQRVIPGHNNLQVGDIFIGIINVQNIDNAGGTIWSSDNVAAGGIDTFTGYFAQQVLSINPTGSDPFDSNQNDLNHVDVGALTVADPFGILAAGEIYKFFVDAGAGTPFISGGTLATTIAAATDGIAWASLGVQDPDGAGPIGAGYLYFHSDLAADLENFAGEGFGGLNIATEYAGYNGGVQAGINDINETELGGIALLNHFVGSFEFEQNPDYPQGASDWIFRSNDPFENNVVPEPGALSLIALSLIGAAVARRRRQR